MLHKCANPVCSTQLVYLREGKIFVMEYASKPKTGQPGPAPAKPGTRLEHFWLCGRCSESLTVTYNIEGGVQVVEKDSKIRRAVAS